MDWIELKSVCFTHTEYVYRESITFHIDLVFASQTLFSNHKETYLTPACINWIYGMIMWDFVVGYKTGLEIFYSFDRPSRRSYSIAAVGVWMCAAIPECYIDK